MRKSLFFLVGYCLCFGLYAIDDGDTPVDTTILLKQVVVSANKIQVNRNSVPLSISVINREEIEASSESALLPVLSQRVPGLFVTRKGITGFGVNSNSAGTVNIRGIGQSNKVLLLFDGQPKWAGIFGHSIAGYVCSFGCGTGRSHPGARLVALWLQCNGRRHQYHHPPAETGRTSNAGASDVWFVQYAKIHD